VCQLIGPAKLVFIYPRWIIDATSFWQWLFPIATAGALTGLWWWRKRSRGPLAAALFFGGTLFPALGFVNVFPFIYSYVADHFQYLASIGVFTLVAAGAAVLANARPAWIVRVSALVVSVVVRTLRWRHTL